MKILLIVPRYNFTNKKNYKYNFPLGLSYISSVLKKENYKVDCLNLNHFDGLIKDILQQKLNQKNYDFVCTGHTGIGYQVIKTIISAVRAHESSPTVILGGAIITSEPELIFKTLQPDYGVLGEGELTIKELINALKNKKDLKKVKGIIYKNEENKIIITEKREVIKDLDSLPFPDFDGFGLNEQLDNSCPNDSDFHNPFDFPRAYPILCSRSCPFQCTFCYHSLGSKYRTRSIDNVMEEIRIAIKKYNINCLMIYDDLFSLNKERLYEFCEKIKKEFDLANKKVSWGCQVSVIDVDEEMVKKVKEFGCNLLSFGFESFSPEVLRSMKKPITPEQIDKALRLTLKNKIAIQANFIFGDVAETKETAYETLNYWKKECKGQISLDFIQPYPGSEIYRHCIRKGLIKDKLEFIKNIGTRYFLNMTDSMTDLEINKLKEDILKFSVKYRYYSIPNKIKKDKNGKYLLKVKCPFCKEYVNYKNFRINNKYYFSFLTICRNCNLKFIIISPIKKVVNFLSPKIFPLMQYYLRLKKGIITKKI